VTDGRTERRTDGQTKLRRLKCAKAVAAFARKNYWRLNSPNINPGAMLEAYRNLKTKPKTITELKEALQVIWGNLPQRPIEKVVKGFSN